MIKRVRRISTPVQLGIVVLILVMLGVANYGCEKKNESKLDINSVKDAHANELMAIEGVVGLYVGRMNDSIPAIGVMVVKKTPELEKLVPKSLEGYPVLIDETGVIHPMK